MAQQAGEVLVVTLLAAGDAEQHGVLVGRRRQREVEVDDPMRGHGVQHERQCRRVDAEVRAHPVSEPGQVGFAVIGQFVQLLHEPVQCRPQRGIGHVIHPTTVAGGGDQAPAVSHSVRRTRRPSTSSRASISTTKNATASQASPIAPDAPAHTGTSSAGR